MNNVYQEKLMDNFKNPKNKKKIENPDFSTGQQNPSCGDSILIEGKIEKNKDLGLSIIKDLGFNIEGIRRMQAILPCWDLLPCEKKVQENCLAYNGTSKPCWMIKEAHCTLKGNECRKCLVYRFGSLLTEDIKDLIHKERYETDKRSRIKQLLNEI